MPKMDSPLTVYIRKLLILWVGNLNPIERFGLYLCYYCSVYFTQKSIFIPVFCYTQSFKNKIVHKLRAELYDKILRLPIGYFTERRKGDLISRITNDVSEVEVSLIGALEGWIRDPLTILVNFVVLFYISPQLTIAILICIPIVGFILGRISRSLKRQSNEAAIKLGESLSILDETLNGLRVIKAFNIEGLLRGRFGKINDELYETKNKITKRRDLASPMSEFLGVLVFTEYFWFGGQLVCLAANCRSTPSMFIGYLALF